MTEDGYFYSNKYYDDTYEYRHVHVPKEVARRMPRDHLLTEAEWRSLGIIHISSGWQHYMVHRREPNVILFRRPLCREPKKPKEIPLDFIIQATESYQRARDSANEIEKGAKKDKEVKAEGEVDESMEMDNHAEQAIVEGNEDASDQEVTN